MLASNNVLFPANGEPSIVPSQDIVLGLYYTTRERVNGKGEALFFMDVAAVQRAYDNREVELQSRVTVRLNEYEKDAAVELQPVLRRFEYTVGRALQIGRAHVLIPVTTAHLECPRRIETKK